jgi:hypothetical protein
MRRVAIVLTALLVLTAGCGGKKKDNVDTSSASSTSSTLTEGSTSTTAAATAGGATATTAKGGSTATTKASPGVTSKPTLSSGAPGPATAGTYDYNQSGTSSFGAVPTSGTLVVDAANGSGVQVFHRYPDPQGQPQDTTMAFRSDGPFITDVVQRQQQLEFRCHFDPAIPAPPWPPDTGKAIKAHANCNGITVDINGTITGKKTVTLDGKPVEVIMGKVTVTTHGQVESTSNREQWWAPSLRLDVHVHDVTTGTAFGFKVNSDVTSDLKSGVPR